MSAMDASRSEALSGGVARAGLEAFASGYGRLDDNKQSALLERMDAGIRKTAHFAEYALLGLLAGRILLWASVENHCARTKKTFFCMQMAVVYAAYTLVFCFLYALSDEFHQMFVAGRSPQMLDVYIDTLGAQTGIVLLMIARAHKKDRFIFGRRRKK